MTVLASREARVIGAPLYVRLAGVLEAAILREAGRGEGRLRIPPERRLAAQFGVSRITVRAALDALALRHPLQRRVGSGIFVRGAAPPDAPLVLLALPPDEVARRMLRSADARPVIR